MTRVSGQSAPFPVNHDDDDDDDDDDVDVAPSPGPAPGTKEPEVSRWQRSGGQVCQASVKIRLVD